MLLTDLSKTFDCLVHDLRIAKLHAYGFEYNAYIATSQAEDSELKLVLHLVNGQILFLAFLRDLFSGHYYLIFTLMTFSLLLRKLALPTMQTITRLMPVINLSSWLLHVLKMIH